MFPSNKTQLKEKDMVSHELLTSSVSAYVITGNKLNKRNLSSEAQGLRRVGSSCLEREIE